MTRYENAPAVQAQNLSKDCKIETLEKDFENILAATSDYYSEALEKLAGSESVGGSEDSS